MTKQSEFRHIAAVATAIILLCATSLWAVDLYLDISKSKFRKVVIAIPDFEGESSYGNEVSGIMTCDLKFSGYFETIDNQDFLKEAASKGEGNFREWAFLGAELVIRGSIDTSDGVVLKCRLYDVNRGKQIFGKVYKGEKKLLRRMVHRFSDEVVQRITGEKGIACTRMAFVSNSSGHKEIYIMDYDGYNPARVTGERSLATVPSWLPDGKRVAYTTYRDGNPDLYVVNVESGEIMRLCTFQGLNYGSAWSPSGKWYVLTLTRDGNAEIYIMRSDGKREVRLTHNRRIDCSPGWSPDGRFIVFTSGRAGGPHIYVMDVRGKRLKRLTGTGYNDSPDWSLKGDRIVYSSQQGPNFDIWIMGSDGGGKMCLTENSGDNENPSFSPDGRHIVFSSTRGGNKNIYVMDIDGSNQKRLGLSEGKNEYPCWSPK